MKKHPSFDLTSTNFEEMCLKFEKFCESELLSERSQLDLVKREIADLQIFISDSIGKDSKVRIDIFRYLEWLEIQKSFLSVILELPSKFNSNTLSNIKKDGELGGGLGSESQVI